MHLKKFPPPQNEPLKAYPYQVNWAALNFNTFLKWYLEKNTKKKTHNWRIGEESLKRHINMGRTDCFVDLKPPSQLLDDW